MSTSTELDHYQPRVQASLPAKIQYAEKLANSGLLPAAYRKQPANVLYAIEYGDMLGLSPMAAITGVHIIEGKPSASAGLISALVRRAGHKLRVTGNGQSATCQIVRCDDPEYTFEVTFSMDDARAAGLANKQVWKQYGASMLKARAITQCARDACEEALYGLHYTPEELGAEVDAEGNVIQGEVVPDEPDPDREWFEDAMKRGASFADEEAGNKLWAEVVKRRDEGKLTVGVTEQVKNVIRDRWKHLAEVAEAITDDEPVEGTIVPDLDPSDPWALRVDEIGSAEDGAMVAAEAAEAIEGGTLAEDKASAVHAAIAAMVARCESAAAA